MAWQPTKAERDLELILLGAMLGNRAVAETTLEEVGNHAFYNSDVGMLVDCLAWSVKEKKPLKESVVFAGWCKRNGIELNGEKVVASLAAVVKGNGKRRAADRALTFARFSKNLSLTNWQSQLREALEEIGET